MSSPAPAGRLGDVLLGAVGACGIDLPGAAVAQERLGLVPTRKACVVLVDGLGLHNLLGRADSAPFLSAPDRLRSVEVAFPSTTATNVTYLGTGCEGGATRMLGYTVRGSRGGLVNLISWNGGEVPELWQGEPTIFERLDGLGRLGVSVGPWRFADSGLTRAAWRGGEYSPAERLAERVDVALRELRDPGVDIVYLYWGDVDAVGHHNGWQSPAWAAELASANAELERLARLLPAGTALLVTADHGMIDVGYEDRIDIALDQRLMRDVDLVGGEPRAVHLYCRPQRSDDVARRWSEVLGERADIFTRSELIKSGRLGPVPDFARSVVGDLVAVPRGTWAIVDSRSQSEAAIGLIGMHGGLTATEMTVPLVTVYA